MRFEVEEIHTLENNVDVNIIIPTINYHDQCVNGYPNRSSVKWSDPGHFLESQGKFFLSFPCTLFYIFLTSKIMDETLKSFLVHSILHYYQIRNI